MKGFKVRNCLQGFEILDQSFAELVKIENVVRCLVLNQTSASHGVVMLLRFFRLRCMQTHISSLCLLYDFDMIIMLYIWRCSSWLGEHQLVPVKGKTAMGRLSLVTA